MSMSATKETVSVRRSKQVKRLAFCECEDGSNQLLVDKDTLENEEHVGMCNPTLPCARFVLDILEVRRMKKRNSSTSEEELSLDDAMDVDQFFTLE